MHFVEKCLSSPVKNGLLAPLAALLLEAPCFKEHIDSVHAVYVTLAPSIALPLARFPSLYSHVLETACFLIMSWVTSNQNKPRLDLKAGISLSFSLSLSLVLYQPSMQQVELNALTPSVVNPWESISMGGVGKLGVFSPKERDRTHCACVAAIIDLPSVCCCSALSSLTQASPFYLPVVLSGLHPHPYRIHQIFANHNTPPPPSPQSIMIG